jgi:hypothetical protein
MLKKKQETLDFFHEMESNIRYRIQKAKEEELNQSKADPYGEGSYELSSSPSEILYYRDEAKDSTSSGRYRFNSQDSTEGKNYPNPDGSGSSGGRTRLNTFVNTRRVRTISTMDG